MNITQKGLTLPEALSAPPTNVYGRFQGFPCPKEFFLKFGACNVLDTRTELREVYITNLGGRYRESSSLYRSTLGQKIIPLCTSYYGYTGTFFWQWVEFDANSSITKKLNAYARIYSEYQKLKETFSSLGD